MTDCLPAVKVAFARYGNLKRDPVASPSKKQKTSATTPGGRDILGRVFCCDNRCRLPQYVKGATAAIDGLTKQQASTNAEKGWSRMSDVPKGLLAVLDMQRAVIFSTQPRLIRPFSRLFVFTADELRGGVSRTVVWQGLPSVAYSALPTAYLCSCSLGAVWGAVFKSRVSLHPRCTYRSGYSGAPWSG